jgi:predicted O-methyltransferase YrrM
VDERVRSVLQQLEAQDQRERRESAPRALRLRSVTPDVGKFLSILVGISGARRILEIGTSGGYSTIWLAAAAREQNARVVTLEADPRKVELARGHIESAGLGDVVEIVEGDGRRTIGDLGQEFDFVFLDAEKEDYCVFLELALPVLRPGGLLVADNLLSHQDELAEFRRAAEQHPQLETLLVPIGRGELLCRKKG